MTKDSPKVLLPCLALVGLIAGAISSPAYAQYRPLPAPGSASASARGENYHVEFSADLWRPSPDFQFASDALGVTGTPIDAQTNLLVKKKGIYDYRLVIKLAARHKLRFAYHSMIYTASGLEGAITFNGREYPTASAIESDFRWKTYRAGYEYDLVSTPRGFFGVVVEAKFVQSQLQLSRGALGFELAKARAPIPAIGAIARVYATAEYSVTAEFNYFKLPSNLIEGTDAHYTELDIYTTYNLTKNIGAQFGYRKTDVGLSVTDARADAKLSAIYFGAVVRF